MLNQEDDIDVSAYAEDSSEAIKIIKDKSIDIAIVDISLKGGVSGIELTKILKNIRPDLPILILSMHDESLYAERAIRSGARGYIMKQEMTDKIVDAIRKIMSGKIYLSDEMSSKLLDSLMYKESDKIENPVDKLTDRELEVFQLIGNGFKSLEIAKKLCISTKTVDTYRQRIKEKLKLNDSRELIKAAIELIHKNS